MLHHSCALETQIRLFGISSHSKIIHVIDLQPPRSPHILEYAPLHQAQEILQTQVTIILSQPSYLQVNQVP